MLSWKTKRTEKGFEQKQGKTGCPDLDPVSLPHNTPAEPFMSERADGGEGLVRSSS